MTAEIGIMNKMAVALAADSAVTIGIHNGQKIYHSANKLFALSKYHPVGIMIYGNAQLMGVPWETIIKVYRTELGQRSFHTLQEYCEDFISFLNTNNSYFPESEQNRYMQITAYNYFQKITEDIEKAIIEKLKGQNSISENETEVIVQDIIRKHYQQLKKIERLPAFSEQFSKRFVQKHKAVIVEIIKKAFEGLPLGDVQVDQLVYICSCLFTRNRFPKETSGVVIAGFGENEIFPSLFSYNIECIIDNTLKYRREQAEKIGEETTAAIIPFAQSEMVYTFLQGIDPHLDLISRYYLQHVFYSFPEIITEELLKKESKEMKKKIKEKLRKSTLTLYNNYIEQLEKIRFEQYTQPILDIVQFLPKDELASMAESLVNLTSFKRKITVGAETVGGPVDVAVISKGDGFIWIKRKHYFDAKLNPHFFDHYTRGVKSGKE